MIREDSCFGLLDFDTCFIVRRLSLCCSSWRLAPDISDLIIRPCFASVIEARLFFHELSEEGSKSKTLVFFGERRSPLFSSG